MDVEHELLLIMQYSKSLPDLRTEVLIQVHDRTEKQNLPLDYHAEYKYRSDEITITQHAYILLYRKIQVNEYAENYMPVQQQKWKILY